MSTIPSATDDQLNATQRRLNVAAAALVWAFRRSDQPSISLAALRRGGMLILLVVVMVVPFVNLWFYLTVGYQYVFGISAARTAVIMIPAQIAGVLGAVVGRKLFQRRGITFTGVVLLLGLAVTLLASTLIVVDSSLWFTILILSGYAFCSVGTRTSVEHLQTGQRISAR